MNTFELVLYGLFATINSFAICLIIYILRKSLKNLKDNLSNVVDYLEYVSDRSDLVYLYILEVFIRELVKEERYEDAKRTKEIFDKELNRLNNKSWKQKC